MDLDQLLAGLRIGFYLGIVFMIGVVYRPAPRADWRPGVSTLASTLAGVSFALATLNVITWEPVATVKELLATLFVGLIFLLTVLARGNVAKMLPRRLWR